ncbi:hypothetical protein AAFF_G00147090 [Aldrovandia affinis]|uniref:Uncharacterized protein n=1 Tax=Aldrovandia affinis TaxID=143900 RepID=A0AAD7W8P7_9TELE|nr:hypothetical protein AAFF_G00147090 [Aldrovandia affinis]
MDVTHWVRGLAQTLAPSPPLINPCQRSLARWTGSTPSPTAPHARLSKAGPTGSTCSNRCVRALAGSLALRCLALVLRREEGSCRPYVPLLPGLDEPEGRGASGLWRAGNAGRGCLSTEPLSVAREGQAIHSFSSSPLAPRLTRLNGHSTVQRF